MQGSTLLTPSAVHFHGRPKLFRVKLCRYGSRTVVGFCRCEKYLFGGKTK